MTPIKQEIRMMRSFPFQDFNLNPYSIDIQVTGPQAFKWRVRDAI